MDKASKEFRAVDSFTDYFSFVVVTVAIFLIELRVVIGFFYLWVCTLETAIDLFVWFIEILV